MPPVRQEPPGNDDDCNNESLNPWKAKEYREALMVLLEDEGVVTNSYLINNLIVTTEEIEFTLYSPRDIYCIDKLERIGFNVVASKSDIIDRQLYTGVKLAIDRATFDGGWHRTVIGRPLYKAKRL